MYQAELTDELRRLPMRHSVVVQLLAVLDDPNSSAAGVAHSMECDPSLCVRVLHLANSPYFGLSGKVASVERAVIALGNSVIRSLAVSTAAGLFAESSDEMPDGFWPHSVGVAAASSLVAQRIGVPAGEALCAGLLHDLGAALAFRFRPAEYRALAATSLDERLDAERASFGADHAELGALALEAWRLPKSIVEAMAHHHEVRADAGQVERCIVAGEALATTLAGEDGPHLPEPVCDLELALEHVGLAGVDIDELLGKVEGDTQDLNGLLAA